MLNDRDLALTLQKVAAIERALREHWKARKACDDLAEADAALVAVRLITPLQRSLETWIRDRAIRSVLRRQETA